MALIRKKIIGFKRSLICSSINGNQFSFYLYKALLLGVNLIKNIKKKTSIEKGEHYKSAVHESIGGLINKPLISIVFPVYNPSLQFLEEAIKSVVNQSYSNWQLCVSDDKSPNQAVREMIVKFAVKDERIIYSFRKENGHISANSNTALSIATGDYVALLDHDDVLPSHCLARVVKEINDYPKLDWLYTDEDKIDEQGYRMLPHRKPSWSPDTLLTRNYITHFVVIKKYLIDKVGGFRLGVEGSQDHDLLLRIAEHSTVIRHIPEILYHWRSHENSVAQNMGAKSYVKKASIKAITDALKRRGISANVRPYPNLDLIFHIDYEPTESVKILDVKYERGKIDSVSSVIEGETEFVHLVYSKEEQLGPDIMSLCEKSEAEILFTHRHDILFSSSESFKKLITEVKQNHIGFLSAPIYQKTTYIGSFGKSENDEIVRPIFQGLYDFKSDDHDYFASTTNTKHVSELFFLVKVSDFINTGLSHLTKSLAMVIADKENRLVKKHHVLSGTGSVNNYGELCDTVSLKNESLRVKFDADQNEISLGRNVVLSGKIVGKNNRIIIGDAGNLSNVHIKIFGDNNLIEIGSIISIKNLSIAVGCHVLAHKTHLSIGDQISMQSDNVILLYNSGNKCSIGSHCLFSHSITVRCGDSPHLIFDRDGNYIDIPKGVKIGDHVWVGERSYIMKNVTIPDDCIVGLASVVTRVFTESFCAIGGNPAKVIKENIEWRKNINYINDESDYVNSYLGHQQQFLDS